MDATMLKNQNRCGLRLLLHSCLLFALASCGKRVVCAVLPACALSGGGSMAWVACGVRGSPRASMRAGEACGVLSALDRVTAAWAVAAAELDPSPDAAPPSFMSLS